MFVQPGLRGSNDLRVVRKMATFCFFSRQAKDLPALLYFRVKQPEHHTYLTGGSAYLKGTEHIIRIWHSMCIRWLHNEQQRS